MTHSPARSRTALRVLAVAAAVVAVAQAVVGVLALTAAEGREVMTAMGAALLVSAAVFVVIAVLCAVALRRMR
ncbi:zinc transporter ZupT [Clavibacter sp. B3I6]|jgi:hypothetical protein|uniref:hypothetical protein n=1 Tax=Clavibacter sp. B3I6 TaxID=3042268 RepID=UPI002786C6C1|nr:hypothetical protein [Clavibacter sp. B3I6]MDQ0744695.1 zinc transporter ZupT [Clavibacter sp. B3I6]